MPAAGKVILAVLTPVSVFEVTVLRTRGMMWYTSDQGAANEDYQGALGMAVVTDRAAAAGIASVPGPVTDGDDDVWALYQAFGYRGTDAGVSTPPPIELDSKAMRKVPPGRVIVFVVENGHATGLRFGFTLRVLAKLTST